LLRSVAPPRLAFAGDAGDAEATVLQRNNFFHLLSMVIYFDINEEAGRPIQESKGRHIVLFFR
jgi:hypothetical protein